MSIQMSRPGSEDRMRVVYVRDALERRVAETKRRARRTLVGGSILLVFLLGLVTAGLRSAAIGFRNPEVVFDSFDAAWRSELPMLRESIGREAAVVVDNMVRRVTKNALKSIRPSAKRLRSETLKWIEATTARLVDELPATVDRIAKAEQHNLGALLVEPPSPENEERMIAFWSEHLEPFVRRAFDEPDHGELHLLIAAHAKVDSLGREEGLSFEEYAERELLHHIAGVIRKGNSRGRPPL